MPLLGLQAPDHRCNGCVGGDTELASHRIAAGRLVEALEINAVVHAADRCGVALLGDELAHDRVAHGNETIDARRNALEMLAVICRAEATGVHG